MIEDILKKEYESLVMKPNKILSIFSDFYGEDKVDLQGLPSLQEFVDYGTLKMNVIEYFLNTSHTYSKEQKALMAVYDKEKRNYDSSFNNPEIFNLFYQDYIINIINRKFKEINILVYFPVVIVTNENNRSIEIRKLFCKVPISVRGLFVGGSLYFNRAEYSTAQLNAGYMHSHVSWFGRQNMDIFKSSCLGSGPIRDTIAMLNIDYNDLRWQLLCFELSKYVQVESIAGTPYNYLEQVSENTRTTAYTKFNLHNKSIIPAIKNIFGNYLKDFTEYLIKGRKLSFNFVNGSYGLAISYIDFNILISNEFITWWNSKVNNLEEMKNKDEVLNNGLLIKAIIINNSILVDDSAAISMLETIRQVESQFACTFKGQRIPIRITSFKDTDNKVLILNPRVSQSIISKILVLINVNYGNSTNYTDPITGSQSTSHRIQGSPKILLINN